MELSCAASYKASNPRSHENVSVVDEYSGCVLVEGGRMHEDLVG